MDGVPARLLVSLSGLVDDAPRSLLRAAAFAAELDARGVPASQLFRPRGARAGSPLVEFLHRRRSAGDAIVLHGYDHDPDPTGAGRTRVGRRAEFAALPRHEAGLRLVAARRALTAAGFRTEVFVPPRWIASPGTVDALREQGFRVLADGHGVRRLDTGEEVRARVLGFRASGGRGAAGGDRGDAWRCRVLLAEVVRTARREGVVRINVRAKDLRRPARRDAALAAVDAALELGAQPLTHRPPAAVRAA
jgi:uncharacterized protein